VFTVHFKNTNNNHQLLDLSLESPEKAVIVVVNDEINRFLNLSKRTAAFNNFKSTGQARFQ